MEVQTKQNNKFYKLMFFTIISSLWTVMILPGDLVVAGCFYNSLYQKIYKPKIINNITNRNVRFMLPGNLELPDVFYFSNDFWRSL